MDIKKIPILLFALMFFLSGSAITTDRYIDSAGTDVGDCSVIATPCLTLQYAVNQSLAGDVINIASGTYPVSGLVSINKSLTLLGAQAGVDARSRVGAESVLSNTQGISVSADNVVFDGLTIQDSNVSAFTGYGIWLNPGVDGTTIINNIFQDNIVGLGLANAGSSQCLIEHNLFQNNNIAGGASGTGIYTDQFVGGVVSNVLINENSFINNENAGIAFSNTEPSTPDSDITITNNLIDSNGRGIYLFSTQTVSITGNTLTNLTAPTDGGSSVGVGIFGGASDVSILQNDIEQGAKYGIRIIDFISSANINIVVHLNNIFGFTTAALLVDDAPVGPLDFATCNYWGSSTGPTNPLNPSGTGDVVDGDLVADNFDPWLLGLAPDSPCGVESPTIEKTFSPGTIFKGNKSTLTITLINPNDSVANLTAPLIDFLPDKMHVSGPKNNTCGGTLTSNNGSGVVTLTGGSIPANGSCIITVKVSTTNVGTYINTIPAGALITDQGDNTDEAEATLTVLERN